MQRFLNSSLSFLLFVQYFFISWVGKICGILMKLYLTLQFRSECFPLPIPFLTVMSFDYARPLIAKVHFTSYQKLNNFNVFNSIHFVRFPFLLHFAAFVRVQEMRDKKLFDFFTSLFPSFCRQCFHIIKQDKRLTNEDVVAFSVSSEFFFSSANFLFFLLPLDIMLILFLCFETGSVPGRCPMESS